MKLPHNRIRVSLRLEKILMFIFWPLVQWWITITKIEDSEISDWRITGILFDISFVLLCGYAGVDFWHIHTQGQYSQLSGFLYGFGAHLILGTLYAKWMKATYNEEVMRFKLP